MTDLTHEEIQDLLGAYALDAVDGDEYEAVELHLRDCPRCRAEVADHREVAALIGHGGAPAPAGVWDRIVEAIEPAPPEMRLHLRSLDQPDPAPSSSSADGPSGPSVVTPLRPSARAGWNRNLLAAAAAVVVVIAVLGAIIVHLDHRVDQVKGQTASAQLRLVAGNAWTDPEAKHVELRSPANDIVVQAALTADGQGYLLAGKTPKLPGDRTYQLWGVVGKNTISLGTFPGGAPVVAFRVDSRVKALAVTEEQSGGVVSSQNDPVFSTTV